MPQIANQDYNALQNRLPLESGFDYFLNGDIMAAIERGTVFDAIIHAKIKWLGNNQEMGYGRISSYFRENAHPDGLVVVIGNTFQYLTYRSEQYYLMGKIQAQLPGYLLDGFYYDASGYLYVVSTGNTKYYVCCDGKNIAVTEVDEKIVSAVVTDVVATQEHIAEIGPEDVKNIVGLGLY